MAGIPDTGQRREAAMTTAEKYVPAEVRHEWFRKKDQPRGTYECPHCKMWTANAPLYRNDICPALDRRKRTTDRREQP